MSTVLSPSRIRVFEDFQIPTEDGELLHGKLMIPKPPMQAQRVVFFVPLVGAGAGQQLLTFRDFVRRGAILISFAYRGHPGSTGIFNLDRTVIDARYALDWALDFAKERGLPLHGFATCYGTVPLLAQFKEGGRGHLLKSVGTVSGLYHLNQILRIEDFSPIVSRYIGRQLDAPAMLAGVADGTLDCDSRSFREAFRDYLSGLMPELRIELDGFEELSYSRVDLRQMLLQFSRANYLDGVTIPPSVPCTAIAGRGDELLNSHTPEGREAYWNRVSSIIPHASVHFYDMDHFGRGEGHGGMIECSGNALERADARSVPPPHLNKASNYRTLPR